MGTSRQALQQDRHGEDHPHAYGDKNVLASTFCPWIGSSPRVWGQALTAVRLSLGNGIIPTRMGTSDYSAATNTGDWDHPHAYGDKLKIGAKIGISGGSSPRVWGQESYILKTLKHIRIIPTRMGTS